MIYKGKFLVKKERDLDGSYIFVSFIDTLDGRVELGVTSRPTDFYSETARMDALVVLFPNIPRFDECELVDAVITVGEGG